MKKKLILKLNWISYTSDFEIAIVSAFNEVFLKRKTNIAHYGCYFHFLKKCRKKLVKEGFGTKDNEAYDTAMKFTSSLLFIKNIEKNYSSINNKFFKDKKNLNFYRDYLIDTLVPFFRNKSLNLYKC